MLVLFITVFPLSQYLQPITLVDPTAPAWEKNAVVNMLIGAGFWIGMSGVESLYFQAFQPRDARCINKKNCPNLEGH